jgi:hypothetical protein
LNGIRNFWEVKNREKKYETQIMGVIMKGMRAHRIKIKVGNLWESPILHILLTKEDDIIVSRCLDFTVSSHGKDEKDALESLADSIKEYVLTAVENNSIDTISDPAHSKYWRMYNELEAKQSSNKLKRTLKQSFQSVSNENIQKSTAEISYA